MTPDPTAELLPTIYSPVRGPRPIDRHCPRCHAEPGWRCRDQRARQRGTATKQTYRPHPERCGRPRQPEAPHPFSPLTLHGPSGPLLTDWCAHIIGPEQVCGRPAEEHPQ